MPVSSAILSRAVADLCNAIREAKENRLSFDLDNLLDARRRFFKALPAEAMAELEKRAYLIVRRTQDHPTYGDARKAVVAYCRSELLSLLDAEESRGSRKQRKSEAEVFLERRGIEPLAHMACEAEVDESSMPFLADHLKHERHLLGDLLGRDGLPANIVAEVKAWRAAAEEIEDEARLLAVDEYWHFVNETGFGSVAANPPADCKEVRDLALEERRRWLSEFERICRAAVEAEGEEDEFGRIGRSAKGASMLDAALILANEDEMLAGQIKARWQRSRNPKPPKSIGFCPSHRQVKLYAPAALCGFIEKTDDPAVCSQYGLRERLARKARAPRTG